MIRANNGFGYFYPLGNVVLSAPFVAVENLIGVSADRNGTYERGEIRSQSDLAALLMAGLAAIIFATSRLILSPFWSVLISVGAAFGTQIWSTSSRAVWSQTWGIFILGLVVWLLLRAEAKQARLHPEVLATLLAWSYFVRPTFSISIVDITVYVLIRRRQDFRPLILTGIAWLVIFAGCSQIVFGQLLPPYYHLTLLTFTKTFWEVLPGNLISPSWGLFVFVPDASMGLEASPILWRAAKTKHDNLTR